MKSLWYASQEEREKLEGENQRVGKEDNAGGGSWRKEGTASENNRMRQSMEINTHSIK